MKCTSVSILGVKGINSFGYSHSGAGQHNAKALGERLTEDRIGAVIP